MECILGAAAFTLTARRHHALRSSDRIFAFGFIALLSLGIATAFACLGAWPILPFAGLETLVLLFAFRQIERHAGDFERATLDGDTLQIEIRQAACVRKVQFNRWWVQVSCAPDGSRLVLRSHGRELEFGSALSSAERLAAAAALRRQLRAL